MKELIPVPKMSEVLREEFMQPLGLSAYRVAKDIMVPVSRIQEILQDKRKITADTDLMDLDLLEAEDTEGLQADLKNIICIITQSIAD